MAGYGQESSVYVVAVSMDAAENNGGIVLLSQTPGLSFSSVSPIPNKLICFYRKMKPYRRKWLPGIIHAYPEGNGMCQAHNLLVRGYGKPRTEPAYIVAEEPVALDPA